ncbi:MAG: hypothetical protein JW928_06505 [Candidatus Aureabacteria bacterium]|nr:hypothetical protein [Candidatus Auribacterota bacterium]
MRKTIMKTLKHINRVKRKIEDLSAEIEMHPNDPLLYYKRGVEWSQRGVFDLALADFTHAISLKQDFAKAYYGRATVYNSLREYEKAREDFQKSHTLLKRLRNKEDFVRQN